MKLVFAALSLWAVAVFALRSESSSNSRYRYNEVEDRDVEPFKAGQTIKYQLDTQISSGIASISDQHAVTRLRAEVQLHFQSERLVSLKLKDIEIGTTNEEIQEPEKVQPFQMFKDVQIKSEELRQLEYPCTFDYTDGLVERIRFHQQDQPWSKNIKKAVLNMLQLNLKQRPGQDIQLEQQDAWQKERELVSELSKTNENKQQHRLFIMPEITLEGECQVSYVVTPMNPRNKFNSYYDDQVSRDSTKLFNVTKTVDFHRCKKIADIRYGPKIEKPCLNSTNLQELEERKLDRTTIMRHVVVGTQEQYGIKKVETVSHYIFKQLNVEEETPMHSVVASRLRYMKVENDRPEIERELKQLTISGNGESLLYSTEWDEQEKRFYMYGDDEFKQQTPFEKVNDKVGKVESLMKKLIGMWSDKKQGIDSEATLVYTRLVDFLRMCTIEDLKTVYSNMKEGGSNSRFSEAEQKRAKDILIDALANAGTHNTVKVLAEKIVKGEIEPARATRAIYQLKSLPAPSEKIIKILTDVCESQVCERHGACNQVCWLNVGTLMGDLCEEERTVDDALEQRKPLCHLQLKKDFVDKAIRQFEKFDTRYQKIVLLKSLGNAGLEPSVYELEKIIRNPKEDPLVRMQAIDSLRRLRAVMPQKIQRVLLPIFQNTKECPEVRMMCASQILATFPENVIIDQIGYTLLHEPSRQVKSYVYKAMKELSHSPIEAEKELAEHLKTLLKLADISEEDEEVLVRGSRYYRIPVYSKARKEGLFFDLESMVGSDNFLPKHLSAGMDTVFNGLLQKNAMELSFTQEDVEQWFEKLMDVYMDDNWSYSSNSNSEERMSSNNRASRLTRRQRDSSESNTDFRKIVSELSLKRRESPRVGSDSIRSNRAPYAMLNYRYGDVDYAVLPLEEEFLPASLKKVLVQGQRPSVSDLQELAELVRGRPFSAQLSMNVLENSIKIPTSSGFPIRMWHVVPVLASIEGQLKPELRNAKEEIRAEIKIHPMIAVTHLKRVEVWSPIVNSGVDSTRTASINLPLTAELKINYEQSPKTLRLNIEIPETRTRLFNLHTLPLTYTSELEWMQQRTPVVKRIENRNLVHRSQHVETVVGKRDLGMPLKITGEVHMPHRYNYEDITSTLMSTENHLHIEFIPDSESPRQISLLGEASFFNSENDRTQHRSLKGFHSTGSKFDREDSEFEDDNEDEKRYDSFLDEYEPSKMYSHRVRVEVKTEGSSKPKQASLELRASCDNQHRFAKASLKVKRSPLHSLEESSQWELNTDAQIVLPEVHSTVQQYSKRGGSEKPQRLVAQVNTEWGSERKQKINLKLQGEQARNQVWIQKLRDVERINTPEGQRLRQQMLQKTAFLNKYDIAAEYNGLAPETKSTLNSLATMLKSYNFWNTRTEFKSGRDTQQPEGQLTATVVIDPITHEHANITFKTPMETVRIVSMVLPMKAKPFKLVKPGHIQQSVDSLTDIIRDYAIESRQECKVGNGKVRSFDDVIFKAPMSKCYTVLAKDCSNSDSPRFAVMMKKLSGNEKALKVITRREVIEVEPKSGKLQVKINGEHETNEDTLEQYGIDYTKSKVRIANSDISVQFDGEEASLKISPSFKNTQCGLCGHYDDDSEDEFRMSNNELTSDLKSYHKSYSLVDDECKKDSEDTYNQEEYKQLKHRREYDQDEEYGQDKKQQKRRRNDNYETDPIEKTEVMEYNHKICFSIKPVKSCPEDSYPGETKEQKVSFTCMDRASSEARRLLREARRTNRPIDLPSSKPSFTENVRVPSTCTVY